MNTVVQDQKTAAVTDRREVQYVHSREPKQVVVLAAGGQGPRGMQGPPGPASPVGGISADDGNALTHGGDGGLYVPDDIPADPLAYYILARS